jgi:hypothetical protein
MSASEESSAVEENMANPRDSTFYRCGGMWGIHEQWGMIIVA